MTTGERIARRLRYGKPIIVVSGLPRSGTSMVMNMLRGGGVPLLTDGIRKPDRSNSRGYFEYEPVKELDKNGEHAWLPRARGKAVKIISFLVTWLPETYDYRVIFMQRDLDEIIASQNQMLARPEEPGNRAADYRTREIYADHLKQVARLLERRRSFRTLSVSYREAVEDPEREARRMCEFLDRSMDIDRMVAIVDPQLYRNRR
jgi:hypothetical protein